MPRALLAAARALRHEVRLPGVVYFLGRADDPRHAPRRHGAVERKTFVLMSRNAVRATAYFRLPTERVVELGVQVEM